MPSSDLVKGPEMGETRGADLTPVGSLATVTDQEHCHLPLWRLDGRVCFSRRDGVAFRIEQEMMDQGFHILLHGRARRRRDLVVFYADGAGRHLVETLVDDAEGLAEFLHAAQIAVVAVAVDADGDVKFDLVVGVVGLRFADVPRDAGAPEHDTRVGVVEGVGGGNDADALGSAFPDPVVGKELFGFVDAVAKLSGPLVDVV